MKLKRLHIMEHPSLHGKPADAPSVEVVWEPHEFDSWSINASDLMIWRHDAVPSNWSEGNRPPYVKNILCVIARGMYGKVWEEEKEYPDAVGSAPVPEPEREAPAFSRDEEIAHLSDLGIEIDEQNEPEGNESGETFSLNGGQQVHESWLGDEPLKGEPTFCQENDGPVGEFASPVVAHAEPFHLESALTPKVNEDEVPVTRVDEPGEDDRPETYTSTQVVDTTLPPIGDFKRIALPKSDVTPPYPSLDSTLSQSHWEHERDVEPPLPGDDFVSKYAPGSDRYQGLGDPTREFKIPEGNTFFDEDVPLTEAGPSALESALTPKADEDQVGETRLDLQRFTAEDKSDK